jgi:tetratricopeptide (TPR) repeat protein
MKINTNDLSKKAEELFKQKKFEDIIALLTDEILEKMMEKEKDKISELYVWRGNAWYNKKNDNKATADYNKAIEINPNYALAFYNRGFAWVIKKEYDKAIEDYHKAIDIDPNYASAYVIKASILRAMKKYDTAIADYNKAIEIAPNYANAYYNRGLAKKENNVDLEGSKRDFEKYLELTADENDIWSKYANYYIECIDEIIDKKLSVIVGLVAKIKEILLINENYITHYTSLSVLKSLILYSNKFRISEGNFMNDPSEGKEFFNFLEYEPYTYCKNGSLSESFSPKPFIGSFCHQGQV